MLFTFVRVEFDAKWNFLWCETVHNVAGLCVPQFYVTIVCGWQELGTIVVETNIFDRLTMAEIRSNASPFFVHFPQLNATVHTAR